MQAQERYEELVEAAVVKQKNERSRLFKILIGSVISTALVGVLVSWLAAIATGTILLFINLVSGLQFIKNRYLVHRQLYYAQNWLACQLLVDSATDIVVSHDQHQYREMSAIFGSAAVSLRLNSLIEEIPLRGPALRLYNHLISYAHVAMRAPAMKNEEGLDEWMDLVLQDALLAKFSEITLAQGAYYNQHVSEGPIALSPWTVDDAKLEQYRDIFDATAI
jgi:hypothetical protein